jgi:AmmeMemoRadiSam system protein B
VNALLRQAAVAGKFYPGDPAGLLADVESYLSPRQAPVTALGCMVPHAGYIFSGHVAGAVFATLAIPATCIVLCPNHTGMGTPLSLMIRGSWQTPLGTVPIDSQLAIELQRACPLLEEDTLAHRVEHGIEVELPFLQTLRSGLSIVPIVIGTQHYPALRELGMAIAQAVRGRDVLIVASSDMNHYENDEITRVKDHQALAPLLRMEAEGLYRVARTEHISMCGLGPAVAMLTAATELGATSCELVRYATSGDIFGDRERVVGYAGVVVR